MKKLMTMIAAAAMAFGLHAEMLVGSDFENGTTTGWVVPDGSAEVKEGSHGETDHRPNDFMQSSNTLALAVSTTVGAGKEVVLPLPNGTVIGQGLYFDGIVNMTVFDKGDDPVATDAKLAVYLQAQDETDTPAVKLVVRAADAAGNPSNYVCTVGTDETVSEGWNRLTIKAISTITATGTTPGFVVYVNGEEATCSDAKNAISKDALALGAVKFWEDGVLFPVIGNPGDDGLTAVAFDGKGSIGEFEVATDWPMNPEFAQDQYAFVLTWPTDKIAEITVANYGTYKTTDFNGRVVISTGTTAAPASVDVTWTAQNGFVDKTVAKPVTLSSDKTAAIVDGDVDPAAAEFEGTAYATLAEAVKAANDAATAGMLKLLADATAAATITLKDGTTLDLAGKKITCGTDVEIGGNITLTNTDTANDGIIDGAYTATGSIAVTNIKFAYDKNLKLFTTDCSIAATLPKFQTFKADSSTSPMYWVIQHKDPFSGGDGTEATPYLITTTNDLAELDEFVDAGSAVNGVYFKQTADIDCASAGIISIGTNLNQTDKAFKGFYDGNGKSINNVTLDGGVAYSGLFQGVGEGGVISNLSVTVAALGNTAQADKGEYGFGCIAGVVKDATIVDCAGHTASAITVTKNSGGIAVRSHGTTLVKNCSFNGTITSDDCQRFGGIVGFCNENGALKIEGCTFSGSLTMNLSSNAYYVAGMVGNLVNGTLTIKDCTATGTLSAGANTNVGAFVGKVSGGTLTVDGENKASATMAPLSGIYANLTFATVENDVATYVKADALALGGAYKVMLAGTNPTFVFNEAGTIAFDTNMVAGVTFDGITVKDDSLTLTPSETAGVVTFTAAAAQTDPVIPAAEGKITPKQGEEGTFVVEPADGATEIEITNAQAGQIFEIASAADVVVKGANGATIKVVVNGVTIPAGALMGAVEGGYSTALNPNAVVTIEEETIPVQPTIGAGVEAEDVDIAAGEIAVKAIPGLTYKLVRSETLGTEGTAVDTKVANSTTVQLADPMEGTKPAAAFYVIEVTK